MRNCTKIILFIFLAVIFSTQGYAASAVELNTKADASLKELYTKTGAAKELSKKSVGILIFPAVYKAGIGIGGEYGEGVLRIKGKTVDYYSTAGASIGFQLGAQKKSIILLFMTQSALSNFQSSKGWEAGVDGSVAIVEFGAGKDFDTKTVTSSIVGFVFSNKGLMYNLSLEGSKMTKIKK
ncbi:MAG: twin-arginine translocation pathway signal protein [Desulfuromusa sp.]|nr:twin-arginine translocation pathway signal protein [Desulfuromusa sp.]